ncbi:NtaA/DmoA family FMN-dependent monooxygenase [Pseudarthrobacter sp. P1]|uniref:NtaA/DmoA family FMN-dependent monooxygenase n=1 Tax=Pseudarthrobacter sp. P1 TaxID=3418418 RepID=UPI003CEB2DDE
MFLADGRAGWNIVTSTGAGEARNFNLQECPSHATRYERAAEFVQTATALWDSWDDDAVVADQAGGIYADAAKIRPIEHDGKHFQVRGPLNLPRPPQGHPLLVQAGSSEAGKDFAARHAEAVFTAHLSVESAREFYADLKGRLSAYGRSPEELKILPGISPYIGRTAEEARSKYERLNSLVNPEYGVRQLSAMLDVDLSGHPLDGPLPELPEGTEGMQSRKALVVELAWRESLTIRQVTGRIAGARGHYTFIGTPEQVADEIELWSSTGAADGFNIMPPTFPGGLDDFVDLVVPILQRRGLFRTEYTGPHPARTLRPGAAAGAARHCGGRSAGGQPIGGRSAGGARRADDRLARPANAEAAHHWHGSPPGMDPSGAAAATVGCFSGRASAGQAPLGHARGAGACHRPEPHRDSRFHRIHSLTGSSPQLQ